MKWLFFSVLLTGATASAKPLCLGNNKAPHRAIYLHGMDSETPSPQEQGNRNTLARVAKALNMVIAVPRGNHRCKGQVCWRQNNIPEVEATYRKLRSDAGACFDPGKGFGLIGFSNGGYFATKVAHFCLKPAPLWVVATGSAGSAPAKMNLENCPRIFVQIGEKDISIAAAKKYVEGLIRQKARAEFSTFPGAHEIKEKHLQSLLERLVKTSP